MYYIYKFYNKQDELLYVGKTMDLKPRFSGHKNSDDWDRKEVSKIFTAECNTATDMDIYEIYYINKLKPKYNKQSVNNDEPTILLPELDFKCFNTPRKYNLYKKVEYVERDSNISESAKQIYELCDKAYYKILEEAKYEFEEPFNEREKVKRIPLTMPMNRKLRELIELFANTFDLSMTEAIDILFITGARTMKFK